MRLRLEELPPWEDAPGAREELAVAEYSWSKTPDNSGLPWDRVLRTGELPLTASNGTGWLRAGGKASNGSRC